MTNKILKEGDIYIYIPVEYILHNEIIICISQLWSCWCCRWFEHPPCMEKMGFSNPPWDSHRSLIKNRKWRFFWQKLNNNKCECDTCTSLLLSRETSIGLIWQPLTGIDDLSTRVGKLSKTISNKTFLLHLKIKIRTLN